MGFRDGAHGGVFDNPPTLRSPNMKKILAAVVAFAFIGTVAPAFAEEKKAEAKPAAAAAEPKKDEKKVEAKKADDKKPEAKKEEAKK
jgi:Ni/Co efflux regulator RcnB